MLALHKPVCFFLLLMLLALMNGCAVNPVTGRPDLVFMSEYNEIKLGEQYHPRILQQYGIYDNPQLQAYISKTGNELANVSHRDDLVFRFTVLDSPQVNAFALPGGYVYITRGILAYLNSEAELAGVLGHEIGHVTHRHAVKQHAAGTVAGIFSTIVAVGTGSNTYTDLSQVFGGALVSGYGRSQELEADARGAEYISKLGYSADNMIDVIGVLKDQESFARQRAQAEGRDEHAYHGLFSTHPKNDTRLKDAIAAAKVYQTIQNRSENREIYLNKINGMIFDQSTKQGIIRKHVFYHPDLNIAFSIPKGWLIKNLPDHVLLLAPNQAAVVQLTLESLHKHQTPKEFLSKRLNKSKIKKRSDLTLNGLQGHTAVSESKTTFGTRPTRFAAAFKDKNVFVISATVKDKNSFDQYDQQFKILINSLHIMNTEEHKIAKPYRIILHKVKPGDTYAKLSKNATLPNYAEQQLRLMNGHYPNGEPQLGNTIKLIK